MKYNTLIFVMICAISMGCVRNKKIIYLQDSPPKGSVSKPVELIPYAVDEYRLQNSDVVDITMKTTSAELNQILDISDSDNQLRNMEGLNSGDVFFLNGYTLDDEGFVDLPLIGQVKLVGMNLKEAKYVIEERLQKFVNKDNYYVRVRLGGIRYSAIGEFNRPGKFTILQNRVTIFEAIANAGDMTTLAKRTEVILMRQYPDGIKTFTVNLLSDKIMQSEFFFIRQNDMIYARPMNVKQIGTGITLAQSFQVLISIVTVWLLYLNVVN